MDAFLEIAIMLAFIIPSTLLHELAHIVVAKRRGTFVKFVPSLSLPRVVVNLRDNPSRVEHLEGIFAHLLLYPAWSLFGLNPFLYPILILLAGSGDIKNWRDNHKKLW